MFYFFGACVLFYRSGTIKTEMFEELKERLEAAADAAHEEYCDAVKVPPPLPALPLPYPTLPHPTLFYLTLVYPALPFTHTSVLVQAAGGRRFLRMLLLFA